MFRKPFSFVSRDTDFANDRKEVVFGQLHPKRPTRMLLDTSESGHWPQLTIPRRVPSNDRPMALDSTDAGVGPHGSVPAPEGTIATPPALPYALRPPQFRPHAIFRGRHLAR